MDQALHLNGCTSFSICRMFYRVCSPGFFLSGKAERGAESVFSLHTLLGGIGQQLNEEAVFRGAGVLYLSISQHWRSWAVA